MVEQFGGGRAQLMATVCQHPARTPADPKGPTLKERGVDQQAFLKNKKHSGGSQPFAGHSGMMHGRENHPRTNLPLSHRLFDVDRTTQPPDSNRPDRGLWSSGRKQE